MSEFLLKAETRDIFGKKVRKGRKEGIIPAVIYGHGIESVSVWVHNLEFVRLLESAGESSLIDVSIQGDPKQHSVLIHDVQFDPMTGKPIHADFFEVRMDEEIETNVALEFVGESAAVKVLGGILVKNIDEVSVRCLPVNLPHQLNVDISALKTFDDVIMVKDLIIGKGVEIVSDGEAIIAVVTPPRSEEELQQLESISTSTATEPELIKKPEKENVEEEK